MRFDLLTIFPEYFESALRTSLLGKSITEKRLSVHLHNIRDYTQDKHRHVDDTPFGGGPGMVFRPEPVVVAVESIPKESKSRTLLLSPSGKLFSQKTAGRLAGYDQLILICGRYEGVDERVYDLVVDESISIGDYILNGGETAALVLIESISRLLPGVVGNQVSLFEESFANNLLEYPQYTRPAEYRGLKVPPVLLSGNHADIKAWRLNEALKKTKQLRPDLLKKKGLQKKKKSDKDPSPNG